MAGYRFYYTDANGTTWTITDNQHAWLAVNGMQGFGVIPLQIAAERRPYRDGMTRTGRPYTGPRIMQIAHEVTHDSHADVVTFLRTLLSRMTPYIDTDTIGTLVMETPDGLTRAIPAWLSEAPDVVWDGPVSCRLFLSFWSESPWFYDQTQLAETWGLDGPGGITFPADFDVSTGIEFATTDIDGRVVIQNAGDVETWPVIRIYGDGDNPVIENETTTKEISITQSMDAGDYIDVDMDAGTVTFFDATDSSSTNIISSMAATSVFWPLATGGNTLHVTMTNVGEGTIRVSWYNRYLSGL